MVNSFTLSGVPRTLFGCGKVEKGPDILREFGENYLCVTGAASLASNPKGKKILQSIENNSKILYRARIIKEPSPVDIDEIVNEYREKEIDAIIAIGGGSVIDAGKAISAMLPIGEPIIDYLEGIGNKKHPGKKIPFIAVPTTAGTGSESTINAVISNIGENGFKRSLRHTRFLPDAAIVDPELTYTCPKEITASSGLDALSQLIESYVSTTSHTFTDSLALTGIELILNNLENACLEGYDKEARTAMSYAAMISGITLAHAGLGLVHGFASSVGGRIDIPHGALCGTLMGIVNYYNVERLIEKDPANPALQKYILLGKMVSQERDKPEQTYALDFISFLNQIIARLNLPRLREFGLSIDELPGIAAETGLKNNPVAFDSEDMIQILRERF